MSAIGLGPVLVGALIAGCAVNAVPGLANAPTLGGTTAETRVHDVVANGKDACERSAFPEGAVLRGQIPPCTSKEILVKTVAFSQPTPTGEPWLSPSYPIGVCPSDASSRRGCPASGGRVLGISARGACLQPALVEGPAPEPSAEAGA